MNSSVVRFSRIFARTAGALVASVGMVGLLGWVFDVELLKAALMGGVTMKANAAVCLMLAGTALCILAPEGERRQAIVAIGRLLAGIVLVVGGLTLFEHLTGNNLGIDQLLFDEVPGAAATMSPGRMGPPASVSFFLGGIALLLLDVRTRGGGAPSQWIGLLIALVASLPLIGYAYEFQPLYGIARYTGIALHTAAAIAVLGAGLVTARPTAGVMRTVAANDAGGIMARRLLLPAVLIPFVLGLLRTAAERQGWLDETFGRPLLVLALIVSLVAVVLWSARAMSRLGRQRASAESSLREAEARLGAIVNNSPAMVYVVTADNRISFINRRWGSVFGLTNEQAAGRSIYEFFPRDVADQFAANNRRVLEAGGPVESEEVVPQTDGPHTYISIKVPLVGPDGVARAICGISTDITDRKRAEEALRASEERYRSFIRLSSEGIWRFELDQPIATALPADEQIALAFRCAYLAECNDAMARMYGYEAAADILGRRLGDFLDPANPRSIEFLRAFIVNGYRLQDAESQELDRDGKPRVFRNSFVGTVESGKLIRAWGTQRDVTDQRRAEAEREDLLAREKTARREAERASRSKDEFLATLSHELRTPLTPVLLTVSVLESRPDLPEEVREDVAAIRRNVELESRLISDLLDLTRISKGKLQLDQHDVDLHRVVRSAVDICQREASAKLTLDLGAPRHTVHGDATRLQQVFWNLINNAIKFTGPEGTITVRSREPGEGRVRIEVKDTGAGIDPEVLPRLFNAFEQGDARAGRQQAGLGLGLAISKKLVEAHGGTITASSQGHGRGSTFTVELPTVARIVPLITPHTPIPPATAERPLEVLVVEDHEPTLRVMSRLLTGLGHRVTGVQTVASATAAAAREQFDLIISDLGLPDGSGLDVMRRTRDRYAGRAIALTGYGMESDITASREAGFAEHLTKPVDLQQLQAAIARISSGPAPAPAGESTGVTLS